MSNDLLVCVDTNVLVALIDSRDKWHEQAVLLLDLLREIDARLVYFDCVINETVGVMGRRTEEQKRSEQFTALLDALKKTVPVGLINWISADLQGLYHRVLDLCRDHGGKLNFNDSLIALGLPGCGYPLTSSVLIATSMIWIG